MRRARALLLVVFSAGAWACGGADSSTDVAMYRGDARNSGVFKGPAVQQPTEAIWRIDAEVGSTPVVRGRTLYFTTKKKILTAVDAASGKTVWTFGRGGEPGKFGGGQPPAADGGRVYWTDDEGLHALDAETGQRAWIVAAPGGSPPILTGGRVYVSAADLLYAVDAASGQERWRTRLVPDAPGYSVTAGPIIAGDAVLVGLSHEKEGRTALVCVTGATGQERWVLRDDGSSDMGPSILAGAFASDSDTIFFAVVGKETSSLRAVDLRSGRERWRRAIVTAPFSGGGVVVSEGVVYVIAMEGEVGGPATLLALAAATGQDRWRQPLGLRGEPAALNELILVDDMLYMGGGPALVARDAATGEERWRFTTDENVHPGPTIADGVLYFAGTNSLRAVR
jgi:outer membrane protein assembly factor BamB